MSFLRQSKLLIALIIIVVLGIFAMLLIAGKLPGQKTTISGTLDYNGTVPDGATVAINVRKVGDEGYTTILSGLTPKSGTNWSYPNAESGKAYDIQAELQLDGKNIATSPQLLVAAPATGEVLVINSTHSPTDIKATISGAVDMNGSVPQGSTIAIGIKSPAEAEYMIVATDLAAVDGVKWNYGDAKEGSLYSIKAFLQVNGSNLYESNALQVAAPASDELLTLNARIPNATPTPSVAPAATGAISGSINLNGPTPSNSTIVIAARVTGTSQFNVVTSNVSANNGATWSWKNANNGTSYDLQAWLQSNGATVIQSQIITVTAPGANETLTLNNASSQFPAPPSSSITSSCGGFNNGQWQVSFNYNNNGVIQNPQQYNLMAGSSSGGSQVFSTITTPGNPGLQQNYTSGYLFNPNQTYYAQYAYSVCTNCNIWSAFSSPLAFTCGGAPATPTPTPTAGPTVTPSPTPTMTPTPTLPPNTSACNQTCESNGYSCAAGLQCVSGSLPGSQVCRNPNCTYSSSCICQLQQSN
jgi:hypothetical protein